MKRVSSSQLYPDAAELPPHPMWQWTWNPFGYALPSITAPHAPPITSEPTVLTQEIEDVVLERIINQHPVVVPDSQPMVTENPPPSPPPADHYIYPRVQFRVGKRDWQNMEILADHLTTLKDHIDILNEFLNRKKNPETNRFAEN
jgi:hypothetical protein